ncbi:Very-long-chain (3R)-3-hydroxyacyl-CoA dehydratase [Liparis tanakae]|uniref:Very-long-chain (3R)-3-hydroxyacyl-CoA dehydratase n=1 Tax=Liparis tanakae TaxID=230148 RepID=A0A4Z2J9M0_9TELE|nr:Very-long-chain (3R)-3-hydroxyacyl-CoA dehydratase [Liparis tanakae]
MPLTPLVSWAQRHEDIYLRVELTDAQVSFRSTQRQVNITLQKEQRGWWERLTRQERKPVFLAPDFDRWLDESDAEMEIREKEEKKNRSKSQRHEEKGFVSLTTVMLFVYNLVQFLGFSWIFVNMTVRLFIFGQDSLYDTFHTISDVMFFCQILAAVEVLNAAFGVVRTAVAVIQSIPVFDETKLFSIALPKAVGASISFSYVLYVYLVLMVLGLFINFRHLHKQRKKRFRTKKRKAN